MYESAGLGEYKFMIFLQMCESAGLDIYVQIYLMTTQYFYFFEASIFSKSFFYFLKIALFLTSYIEKAIIKMYTKSNNKIDLLEDFD
jgi:hypothetical protein